MGRRRTHLKREQPLPAGLYKHRRQYRARLRGSPWVYFGTDYVEAMQGYAAWKRDGGRSDTVAWLLDIFTGIVCPGKVKAEAMAKRTAKDYAKDAAILKAGLGHFPIKSLEPKHVAAFRDARAQDAPRHVRNEMACLSAAMAYAVESGRASSNPCREVKRPRKIRRERLITNEEYLAVYSSAGAAVRRAMALAVRTLALPADILALGPRNILRRSNGERVLRFSRGKTRVIVEIEIVGELAKIIDECLAASVVRSTFVHREDGERYTTDGLTSMFRRHCIAAKVSDFGLRDLRAKGATDEYRAGRPIRELQHLLGHKSVRTTEIYLKELIPETVRPNERPMIAGSK